MARREIGEPRKYDNNWIMWFVIIFILICIGGKIGINSDLEFKQLKVESSEEKELTKLLKDVYK